MGAFHADRAGDLLEVNSASTGLVAFDARVLVRNGEASLLSQPRLSPGADLGQLLSQRFLLGAVHRMGFPTEERG